MLTIFTCPKPFKDHIAEIQYNAIKSWTLLEPYPQVIVFGLEAGTREIAHELNIQHIPDVVRNEQGTPLISDIFANGQLCAVHPMSAYLNADIILLADFMTALERVRRLKKRFLMVGQRCNLDVIGKLSFSHSWQTQICEHAKAEGQMFGPIGIDYFVFPTGTVEQMPPFAVGRAGWDNWMIYDFRRNHIPIVDATASVLAIHQNHSYSHHPEGWDGAYRGVEAQRNIELAGGRSRIFTLSDATHTLTALGLQRVHNQLDARTRLKRLGILYPHLSKLSSLLVRGYDAMKHRRLI